MFVKQGKIADIMQAGRYKLTTDNFPILSSLKAFPTLFVSPIVSDVYFVNMRQVVDNKWATKNPVMKRDKDFNMVRVRAFGKFSFRISDIALFMREVFGTMRLVTTYDIVQYLDSIIIEAFALIVGSEEVAVLDIAMQYRNISEKVKEEAALHASKLGIKFADVLVENISLPEEVEKIIDEQSGIGVAKQDMSGFMQYQTARAMRDAAQQENGLAGIGAGAAFGNVVAKSINEANVSAETNNDKVSKLRELKSLLDDGILTQEEFDAEKKKVLM